MKLARRKSLSPNDPTSSPLGRELRRCATRRATGEITMLVSSDAAPTVAARVFTFEGGVYAASVDGFTPQYEQRLVSGRAGANPTPEVLAGIYQENLLALVGELLQVGAERVDSITFHDGTATDTGCTLPIEWTTLLAIVGRRRERAGEDLKAVGLSGESIRDAAGLTVQRVDADQLMNVGAPELHAFLAGLLATSAPLDEVAHAGGFTRAEALHLARLLGSSTVQVTAGKSVEPHGALVPEAVCV